jgi:hypothetical protein
MVRGLAVSMNPAPSDMDGGPEIQGGRAELVASDVAAPAWGVMAQQGRGQCDQKHRPRSQLLRRLEWGAVAEMSSAAIHVFCAGSFRAFTFTGR